MNQSFRQAEDLKVCTRGLTIIGSLKGAFLMFGIVALGALLVFIGEHFQANAEVEEGRDERTFTRSTDWILESTIG